MAFFLISEDLSRNSIGTAHFLEGFALLFLDSKFQAVEKVIPTKMAGSFALFRLFTRQIEGD